MKAIELYIADLKCNVHEKRKRAINALISLKEKESIKPLLVIAGDMNVEIRYMIAKAFGVFEDRLLIEPLLKYLKDESPKVRYRAAMSLMTYRHEKIPGPLIDALGDSDENVRYWVAKAIAKMADESVISRLQQCLSSGEWVVRKTASDALVEIGVPALSGLYETLLKAGDDAKFWAIKTIGRIADQSSTTYVLPFLADKNQDVRIATIKALGNISDSRSINPLIILLEGYDNHLKPHISEALCKIGDKSLNHLIKVLSSSNWSARRSASRILGEIGGRSIEFLMSELKKHDDVSALDGFALNDDAVFWIIEALGEIGDRVVTLNLIDFLKHKRTEIKIAVIRALGKIKDDRALEPLLAMLECDDDDVAKALVKTISCFGEASIGPLIKNLGSNKWQVRSNAAMCLMGIGILAAGRMVELLDCKNRDVCHWASEVIVSFGGYLEDELINLIENGNYDQRFYASRILGRIKSKKAVSVLISALQDEYWTVRKNAAFSLGEIALKDSIPALVRSLKDEDEDLRAEVCVALSKIGYPQVGKYLTSCIDDEFSNVRIAAITAVGDLGCKDALPSIAAHINDDDMHVRSAAIQTAGKLKGEACVNLLLAQMNVCELRSVVIASLGEIGAVSSIKHLNAVLSKSENRDERAAAALALSNYDQREVIKSLSEALSDEYYMVRKNAALSLTVINEKRRVQDRNRGFSGDASSIDSMFSLGMAFLNAKKFSDAVVAFQKLIAVSPKNYNALIKLGIAYENKDMINEAIECFTKCVAYEPNRPEAHIYLAVAQSSIKKHEEALINLKRAEECAKNQKTLEIIRKLIKKIKTLMYGTYDY